MLALRDAFTTVPSSDKSPTVLSSTAGGGLPLSTVPGVGIFFDKSGNPARLPPSFTQFVLKFAARPAIIVLFNMRPMSVPSIPAAERYVVTRVSGLDACYSVTLRHGYTDNVLYPGLARDILSQIELAVSRGASRRPLAADAADADAELEALRSAYGSQMVYVLGKGALKIRGPAAGSRSPWAYVRPALLGMFLWIRENSRTKLADLDIDADKVVEVGFIKEI